MYRVLIQEPTNSTESDHRTYDIFTGYLFRDSFCPDYHETCMESGNATSQDFKYDASINFLSHVRVNLLKSEEFTIQIGCHIRVFLPIIPTHTNGVVLG